MPAYPAASKKGFALLITIVLVAFLVLVLVGLATYTRVETQVAANSQQLAQARQNALMALNIAVGELQKYTGPDQRTTARSDMDATLANTTTASGRWVGAYGNSAEANYAMTPSAISTEVTSSSGGFDSIGRQSTLLNWLVSGNENTAFDPSTNVSGTGRVTTSPTQFEFAPSGAVAGLGAATTALSANLTVADRSGTARPAQLLVGPNSAGNSVSDFVVAPLREISAVAPGLGATPVPVGRYAWWVGDEGAKARIDLPMASAAQAPNAFVSSPRAGVELVDAINPSTAAAAVSANAAAGSMLDPDGSASRYDPAGANLSRLLAIEQFPMIAAPHAATLSTAIKYRFHDLGVSAASVIADAYAGGLKKDLSALLASGASTPANTEFLFKPESGGTNHLGVPTWGQLRSFAQTASTSAGILPQRPEMTAVGGFANAPVPTNVGIHPVMTYAAVGFRYLAPNGDAVGDRVSLVAVPIVVLWNPYTVPIRGTDGSGNRIRYEMGMRKAFAAKIQLQGKAATDTTAWGAAHVLSTVSLDAFGSDRFLRFVIESPATGIPPGESLVFTLDNNGDDYSPGANVMVNGLNDDHYVAIRAFDHTITSTEGAGATYRVGVNGQSRYTPAVPQTMWGQGTDGNWGGAGNGWHETYFGEAGAGWPLSEGYPWATTLADRGIYQFFSHIASPTTQTPPYGSSYNQSGYAVSNGPSGLVQPEGTLGTNLVTHPPTFRLVTYASFSYPSPSTNRPYGRSRWMLQSNIRGLMMVDGATIVGRPTEASWPCNITSDDDIHVASGSTIDGPLNNTILYEFRPDTMPLLSIGQLQHANLGSLSSTPGNAIGNSNGVPGVHYNGATRAAEKLVRTGTLNANPPGNRVTARYDQSWLLNRALWDKYFVSTVPHSGTGRQAAPADTSTSAIPNVLPNPLHVRYATASPAQLRDPDVVASKLLLKGGFNINSTSEQAWRAILGASNRLDFDPTGSNAGGPAWKKVVFSRFSQPHTNSRASAWDGYVQLDEGQIAQLARNIVTEIRTRGPFVSLGDFINRRLADGHVSRLKGTLQAAIDATTSGATAANRTDSGPLSDFTSNYRVVSSFGNPSSDEWEAGSDNPATPTFPYGTSGAGSPQFLTQADVLTAIGSKLSARSDTFVVRTYGEVLDPVNSTATAPVIVGRAWCEATIQRLPEYTDDSITPETDLRTAPASSAVTTNQRFGRKYKIVSFRWLSPDDI